MDEELLLRAKSEDLEAENDFLREHVKELVTENARIEELERENDKFITEIANLNKRIGGLQKVIEIQEDWLKKDKTKKQNNSLVTDDTAAIVEAYEQLSTAYGIAETLAKLYAVREAGKPVELTASEIAYKIDTAIKLLKDEE